MGSHFQGEICVLRLNPRKSDISAKGMNSKWWNWHESSRCAGHQLLGLSSSAFEQGWFSLVTKRKPGNLKERKKSLGPRFSALPGNRGATTFPRIPQ